MTTPTPPAWWFANAMYDQIYPQFTPDQADAAVQAVWEIVRDRLEIRCVGCRMSDGRSHDLKDCRL